MSKLETEEVVLCQKCKYYCGEETYTNHRICKIWNEETFANGWCYMGERKEQNERSRTMIVIDKKPIPYYESKCDECKSVFRYKKSEVSFTGFITCPVCGYSVWANTTYPVYNREEQNE